MPAQHTVLIVDDEHSVCMTLSYLLSTAGYRALTAESGHAAMVIAETEIIDGALIDVHMPRMNGFDTCIGLRAKLGSVGRNLRVWFITGGFTTILERRCAEVGGLAVLPKPFEFRALLAQLEAGFSSPLSSPPPPPLAVAIGDSGGNSPP